MDFSNFLSESKCISCVKVAQSTCMIPKPFVCACNSNRSDTPRSSTGDIYHKSQKINISVLRQHLLTNLGQLLRQSAACTSRIMRLPNIKQFDIKGD